MSGWLEEKTRKWIVYFVNNIDENGILEFPDGTKIKYLGFPSIAKDLSQALIKEILERVNKKEIINTMDCLGYEGLGTKLTSKEIELIAQAIHELLSKELKGESDEESV